jgi:hypothetical protein
MVIKDLDNIISLAVKRINSLEIIFAENVDKVDEEIENFYYYSQIYISLLDKSKKTYSCSRKSDLLYFFYIFYSLVSRYGDIKDFQDERERVIGILCSSSPNNFREEIEVLLRKP